MNILAFDTAGSFLSTGLKTPNGFYEENRDAGLKHSEYLLPAVETLMEKAGIQFPDLDLIVCSKGPGSFTGLRIGMSTAKGLSAGCGAPVVSVNNLDAHAFGLKFFDGAVVPVIDARKKRFYTAFYINGAPDSDYLDISAEELVAKAEKYKRILLTGPGISVIKDELKNSPAGYEYFENGCGLSTALIKLGRILYEKNGPDPDDSGPFYIRLSDAELLSR